MFNKLMKLVDLIKLKEKLFIQEKRRILDTFDLLLSYNPNNTTVTKEKQIEIIRNTIKETYMMFRK